jgi:hypothetical protein
MQRKQELRMPRPRSNVRDSVIPETPPGASDDQLRMEF